MILGLWFVEYKKEQRVFITLTENGFEPTQITILQGQTVTFVSEINSRDFWPASNEHPSHGLLPEFDPKKPISSSESWSYRFADIGSWGFHDHLDSSLQGTITVYSTSGKHTADCVDRDNTSRQAACWAEEFREHFEKGGLDEMFLAFNQYLKRDPLFKNNCHDIMHIVGEVAYSEYVQTGIVIDRPETATCGYGFYHGFIETMAAEEGNYTGAKAYCDLVSNSDNFPNKNLAIDAGAACRHGFGHSIFDSIEGSAWGDADAMVATGLAECENIFNTEENRRSCSTGVFNSLAIALFNNFYKLAFDKNDPLHSCRIVKDLYKSGCFIETVVHYAALKNLKQADALQLIYTTDPISYPITIEAYTSDQAQWRLPYDYAEFKKLADWCIDTIKDPKLEHYCLRGIHFGIYKMNDAFTQQAESQKICDLYSEESVGKDKCEKAIPKILRTQ